MIIQNATNFRKNLFETLNQVTKYNETAAVTTKDGGAVMIINKDDYDALIETLYCETNIPDIRNDVKDALDPNSKNYMPEDAIKW